MTRALTPYEEQMIAEEERREAQRRRAAYIQGRDYNSQQGGQQQQGGGMNPGAAWGIAQNYIPGGESAAGGGGEAAGGAGGWWAALAAAIIANEWTGHDSDSGRRPNSWGSQLGDIASGKVITSDTEHAARQMRNGDWYGDGNWADLTELSGMSAHTPERTYEFATNSPREMYNKHQDASKELRHSARSVAEQHYEPWDKLFDWLGF